jgi:hypothetical protein
MQIKELKKELNISNADIAKCFGMSYNSFANSTAKERYENALLSFYKLAKKAWEKNKTKKQISDNLELSDNKQLIIHGVMFSEARAEVCKNKEHWKNCLVWTKEHRCLKNCDFHSQT